MSWKAEVAELLARSCNEESLASRRFAQGEAAKFSRAWETAAGSMSMARIVEGSG